MTSMERHARATAQAREYLAEQHVECLQHAPSTSGHWYCVLRTRHPDRSELTVKGRGVSEDASLSIAWHELRLECLRYYLDEPAIFVAPAGRNEASPTGESDPRFDVVYEAGMTGVHAVNDLLVLRGIGERPANEIFSAARPFLLAGASAPGPTVRQVADVITNERPQLPLSA